MRPMLLGEMSPETLIEELGANPTRLLAARRLAELGMPTRKSEAYRYFDIEPLMEHDWEVVQIAPTGEIARSRKEIVITDGVVTAMPESAEIVVGCSDAVEIDGDHFDPLYYLGHLMSKEIISIRFKQDAKVTIVHRFTRPGKLLAYRTALYVDANVRVQVDERYEGAEACGALVLGGYDAFIARDADLRLIKDQTLKVGDYTPILSHRIKVDSQAHCGLHTFDFGQGSGLQLIRAELHKHAGIDADHLLYAADHARRGTVSQIVHIGQSSLSNQRAKNILAEKARGIFDALIKVEHTGKYTKAHQNSKAILLNDGAYMASKPQLEIYIDDLEASHGSTTGQLDEAQLFYLRSRGISKDEARKMLILGFANELIDALEDEGLRERIHASFETAYWGQTSVSCMETCHGCEDAAASS
ncbi:SufD family Fe-S cluster assembly protein [Nitratifractor salsuginis]|uniref:SufBD protein n=1 Tax=Nitratifractor salsuginis (strain DSM 16511 / JCM 12458 / E9I37-1) TaxID=749222 RepID=E6WYY8_NITSE|nr:SufD family Fe-S cluster assembly protein [Nitratifractor salsuginis]ADV46574.1 SufBD protein [Nitratifractor salsuginis DSM 16511]